MIKIRLLFFIVLLGKFCAAQQTVVTPIFTTPDTVCVNTPVTITNTTVGATNYYWNFCVAGINTTPSAVNLGNPGNLLSQPVFSDIVEDNGNYYAFVVDFYQSGITRLDFGNSMLNTPIATDLGNPSGALNFTYGKEGIQVVKNEGKWYAIIVGGWSGNGSVPKIVKIEFGANINNNSPTGTDWGNLGNLLEPIDLHLFNDNGNWYGFTTNAESNTITRFNFTNSFDNTPTAINLGNIGGLLDYPTGIYAINDNGFNRVFVCNGKGNSLVRLDFGNSLLNTPTPVLLGNPSNVLNQPRDMTILRLCGEIAGFAVNATNELVKMDFHNDLLSVPTGSSLGNVGNFNFPHSLSKFFRVGNDLYTLITNVSNNTITRLEFAGCTTANIASSNLQNPPAVTYNTPGTYSINLTVDEGLPTQNSFCKQVVVVPPLQQTPTQKVLSCNNKPVKIGSSNKQASYLWNTGETTDSIIVTSPGKYWVITSRYGCSISDTFNVVGEAVSVKTNNDTTICVGASVQLNVTGTANSYSWSPATDLSNPSIANPIATPLSPTQYVVTAKSASGCIATDTVVISLAAPSVCSVSSITPDFDIPDTVCVNTQVNIVNKTTGASSYFWNFCVSGINSTPSAVNLGNPGGYLSKPVFSDIIQDNGNYYAFVVNHLPGGLVRLDFGNSMLNTPIPYFLGNPSGAMNPTNGGNEGIQVVKNEGKWYAIIVGGNPIFGTNYPRIVKIEFGTNIANNSPTGTNWGNLGNLNEPIDLHMFQDNNVWYGFTVNAESNTITRFNFTSSFNNTPTAVNLGNIGALHYPTGIYAINDNGNWRVFIGNAQLPYSLTRLDFGNSLLNTPTGTNLGNPGNALNSPRDFTILKLCGEITGFAVNGVGNDLAKFNFNNDLSSVPTGVSLGNTGNLNFPHSLSKFFRAGNDIYTLITNVNNNTITRLRFAGCTAASIASSSLQTPPPITYNTPGTYNINLSIDEGLPTQNAYCKQIVVLPQLVHTPLQKIVSCNNKSVKVGTGAQLASYLWNTGATTDSIDVSAPGIYWVQTSRFGCTNVDSFTVAAESIVTKTNNDTTICIGASIQLMATAGAAAYSWSPVTDLNNPSISNPVATPSATTQYIVTATSPAGCIAKDTVVINIAPPSSCKITAITPDFLMPDTVCVNTAITITNKTSGASTYYWNYCMPDLNTAPTAVNLGNIGNMLAQPSFLDYAQDNGNYYAFLTDVAKNAIVRLDFGNSLLNTPTATNLGNFNGTLISPEGIQVIQNEGKWYAIVTCLETATNVSSIDKIEFGANITNPSPVLTNWGNIGNIREPMELQMFKDGNNWYGFTTNGYSNTITRFSFTNSFNNIPTGVNLGNIGNLNEPSGMHIVNDNGNWRMFIVNGAYSATANLSTLSRLDFGSSLLNMPTGVNLGNPGNLLSQTHDITIVKSCNQIIGFAVNALAGAIAGKNDMIKFDFNNDLTSIPSAVSLGNFANFFYPNSISKLFRDKDNQYAFIPNTKTGALVRVQFAGCTNSDNASSNLQNPPAITYKTPGTYNVSLIIDEGLITENNLCKQVVVMPAPNHTPLQKTIGCNIDSLKIGTGLKNLTYLWNTGASTDSIYIKNAGDYWVKSNTSYGCANTDSFSVRFDKFSVATSNDAQICVGKTIQLNAAGSATSYSWSPATGLSNTVISNPIASPTTTTQYIVTGTGANGCQLKDTVVITVNNTPVITKTPDSTICHDKTIQLNVSGGNTYTWAASPTLSSTSVSNPMASPVSNTTYYVTVTDNNLCSSNDSIKIAIAPKPVFTVSQDQTICKGSPVQLLASGGDSYIWTPADGLNNAAIANPFASPETSAVYTVKINANACNDAATLSTNITVNLLPVVTASRSNDVDCTKPVSVLNATGAATYLWQPANAVSDTAIASPHASPEVTTTYIVKGIDGNGCSNYDSVKVLVTKTGDLVVNMPNAFSPNGDGNNDCFGINRYTGLLKNVDFSVYDRWGVRVFHSNNTQNCWDGRYKGKVQDIGGFVYILKASTFCGEIFKKGIVMLVK